MIPVLINYFQDREMSVNWHGVRSVPRRIQGGGGSTIITSDLKWELNTQNIVKKSNARMQLLRRVASFGLPENELVNVYILFIRSLLEQSAVVWHSSLTQENIQDLERVQKSALRVILGERYKSYKKSLDTLELETLKDRREQLCLNFAK